MLKKILITTFIIIAIFFLERVIYIWTIQNDIESGLTFLAVFSGIPAFLWLLFYFLLRKWKEIKYVVPSILTINGLILVFLVCPAIFNGIDYSYYRQIPYKLKEKRAKLAVRNWLNGNLSYPDSLKYFNFNDFQISKPNDYLNVPSYYFINCGFWSNINNSTLFAIDLNDNNNIHYEGGMTFQLDKNYKVLNVRIKYFVSKYNSDSTKNGIRLEEHDLKKYMLREKFCKPLINLELELPDSKIGYHRYLEFNDRCEVKTISELRFGEMNGWHIHMNNETDTLKAVYFSNGKPRGPFKEYHDNGQLRYFGYIADSSYMGKTTWWYRNGIKQTEGYKFKSKLEGEWKYWDSTGVLEYIDHYKNDVLIDSKKIKQ